MSRPTFKREIRYHLIKWKDLSDALRLGKISSIEAEQLTNILEKIKQSREEQGKPPLVAVCIESKMKCFEAAWALLESEYNDTVIPDTTAKYLLDSDPTLRIMRVKADDTNIGVFKGDMYLGFQINFDGPYTLIYNMSIGVFVKKSIDFSNVELQRIIKKR